MALKRISCLLTTLRDEAAFRRLWMRGVAPEPCPGAWRPHPWLTIGKVALFEASFVRLNLYKYSYCFQLRLLSALLSTPAAFIVYRVSSVLSSSSRQNQTSAGGAACFRLPHVGIKNSLEPTEICEIGPGQPKNGLQ